MAFWKENVDRILEFNEKPILQNKGSISNAQMEKIIDNVYQTFDAKRKLEDAQKADQEDLNDLKALEQEVKNRRK